MTPASIRNNNPGAMEPGPSSKKFGSTSFETLKWTGPDGKPKTNRIATFPTPQHGAAAMFDLLERKYTGKPLKDAISTWCGSYWAGEYAKSVENACGITGGQLLTKELVRSPDHAIPLCQAMAKVEAGRDFPMEKDGWEDAHRMAFSQQVAPAPSPDNDVPYQKPEAKTREAVSFWGKLSAALGIGGGGLTQLPPPPDWLTTSSTNLASWKGLIADPLTLAACAIIAAIFGVPKIMDWAKG